MKIKREPKSTCVYLHINPIKQEIFYVGIGNIKRPYHKFDRSTQWKRIVNKYDYIVVIIHKNLKWGEACDLEKSYIKQIGRKDKKLGTLVNYTNGGDGAFGVIHKPWTEERKKEQSLRLMGKNVGQKRDKEFCELMRKLNEGKIVSNETKKK